MRARLRHVRHQERQSAPPGRRLRASVRHRGAERVLECATSGADRAPLGAPIARQTASFAPPGAPVARHSGADRAPDCIICATRGATRAPIARRSAPPGAPVARWSAPVWRRSRAGVRQTVSFAPPRALFARQTASFAPPGRHSRARLRHQGADRASDCVICAKTTPGARQHASGMGRRACAHCCPPSRVLGATARDRGDRAGATAGVNSVKRAPSWGQQVEGSTKWRGAPAPLF